MRSSAIEDVYELSPAQQGMLLRTLSESDPAAHVVQSCAALTGRIDPAFLEGAWQWAVDRHPMLRTAFVWQDLAEPMQAVMFRARIPFRIEDWRGLAPDERQRRSEAFIVMDRSNRFQLSQPPLMRLALIRTGEAEHRLIWSRHPVLLDGWSTARLLQEVQMAYGALSQGKTPMADAPGVYKEYIAWLHNQDWTAAESFWESALRGIESPTPLGRVSPATTRKLSAAHDKVSGHLEESPTTLLRTMTRDLRLTLNTLVQGAWAMLLSRYSERSEVLFGTTVAGRPAELPSVETTLGLFTNTLPMRVTVPRKASLGSWLATLQAQHTELRRYEFCSAGQVHGWSNVAGGSPLYESCVVFQNYPGHGYRDDPTARSGSRSDERASLRIRSDYPLTIHALTDPHLILTLVSDTNRLDEADLKRILEHLIALLEAIASKPHSCIGQLVEAIPKSETPCVRAATNCVRREGTSLIAPRNHLERALASIWSELLGVSDIGIEDNFFALRGHSLLAMRLISRIRDAFQVELPLSRLFASPTIAQLSSSIEEVILEQIEALSEEEARWQTREVESATQSL